MKAEVIAADAEVANLTAPLPGPSNLNDSEQSGDAVRAIFAADSSTRLLSLNTRYFVFIVLVTGHRYDSCRTRAGGRSLRARARVCVWILHERGYVLIC